MQQQRFIDNGGTEFLRYQITDRQRIGYNIDISCIAQSKAPEDGQDFCSKHVELNWIYQ